MITNDARCIREIKTRVCMAKAALNKKQNLSTSKLDLNLRKKLRKCNIWIIALYAAENWTLRKVDRNHLKNFEIVVLEKEREDCLNRSCEK
jgi:hypothetical protein